MTTSTEVSIGRNAKIILEKRYLKKDDKGKIVETIPEMFKRVATAIAKAEKQSERTAWKNTFYEQMALGKFLPNSPTMMNAGINGTLSACFVIGIEDSMTSILEASRIGGLVLKFGGGTGYSLSQVRSKGIPIKSTHGKACGPIAILHYLDALSKMITQGGKRNGANMGILEVSHPDILEFIHCKDDWADNGGKGGSLGDFNISVGITDKFMNAVRDNSDFPLIDPSTKKIIKTVNARNLFAELVKSAWKTGDPGLVFLDEINRKNKTPHLGRLESTNPCGEVPLYPNEACNLASINLGKFWNFETETINYEELDETVEVVVRFLDNVVTVNDFPIPEIEEAVAKTRKIGLGVMGWADLLIYARIPYESHKALELAEKLMKRISNKANEVSLALGGLRGPYPAWDEKYDKPYRNATRTCIAPTGTISRIAGASSGIEPLYALAFESFILDGERLQDLSESFEIYSEALEHPTVMNDLVPKIIENNGSIKGLGLNETQEDILKTALEIEPVWHIRHQAIFQKYTDLAVSKTINLPETATVENIQDAYIQAHQTGCKGITVYRAGSREQEVLNAGRKNTTIKTLKTTPWGANANSFRISTPDGLSTRVIIVKDNNDIPREVFITIGKSGHDLQADMEAIGRLCSLALRYNIPLREVWGQLVGIKSDRTAYHENRPVESYPDGIALALEEFLEKADKIESGIAITNGNLSPDVKELVKLYESNHAVCPDCKNPLIYEEGCQSCTNSFCGFSKC